MPVVKIMEDLYYDIEKRNHIILINEDELRKIALIVREVSTSIANRELYHELTKIMVI